MINKIYLNKLISVTIHYTADKKSNLRTTSNDISQKTQDIL